MRKFMKTILAAMMLLPIAAHASLTSQSAPQAAAPMHLTNYPDQAAAALDPAAAPEAFTTKQHPIARLNNAQDFYLVNPGGNSIGGGDN